MREEVNERLREMGSEIRRAVPGVRGDSWEKLRNWYIQGYYDQESERTVYPELKEIAKELGISVEILYTKAREEKWDTFRALFQQKRIEKNKKEQMLLLISEGARHDQRQLRNFEKIVEIVERKLDKEYGERMVQDGDAVHVEIVEEISPKDLHTLTSTLVVCRDQIKNIIGEERLAIEIANEIENERKALKEGESADEKLQAIAKEVEELRKEKEMRKKRRLKGKKEDGRR